MMLDTVLSIAIPVVLAIPATWLLRPLFARFLREATQLFTGKGLAMQQSIVLGSRIAIVNMLVFLIFWCATYGCWHVDGPFLLTVALAVSGVLLGVIATVGIVQNDLNIQGSDGVYVGLITFVGGNLPLIFIVPTVLVVMVIW